MILEDCPTTERINDYWKGKILDAFPILDSALDSKYLSLKEYLTSRPQKFYCQRTFENYLSFLVNLKSQDSDFLVKTYKEFEHELNISIKTLNDINSLAFHDTLEPKGSIESILFIENNIHFNYVKLIEAVYHKFLLFIACYQRALRDKQATELKIFDCILEIKKTDFKYVTDCYESTIRNAVAHGGVTYKESDTIYKGGKGNPYEIKSKKIIRMFDDLLDICNGFSLAFKVFVIINRDFFQDNNMQVPKSFLLQELKAQANAPKWEVVDCLESTTIDGKKQLNVFTKNKLLAHEEVHYYSFRTAVLAEYFATGYDRYYFSLDSKYSLNGWCAYNGLILKKARILNNDNLNDYKSVLEENLLFFIPKIKIPKFIRISMNAFSIIKSNFQIECHKLTNNIFKTKYKIRDAKPFRRGFSIISDPSIYILPEFKSEIINIIQDDYKKIVSYSIKKSKRRLKHKFFRFLPTSYIKITIYEKDLRKRQLRNSGLSESLICSITVNNSKIIKEIDFAGGKVEQKGKYRIVWNKNWSGAKHVC